ncbi:hypothetical protein H4R33_000674 [Dimargaris cristalligena]|nr:hypothetical protein H4R33_000674 [Dimargaris cristalligena]
MRFFGAAGLLLLLGAVALSHGSEQDNQGIKLNDLLNLSSPDIGYEDAAAHLALGPFYREASWKEVSDYISTVNGKELAIYITFLELYLNDDEVKQAYSNEELFTFDGLVNGTGSGGVSLGAEASGSGSGSGSYSVLNFKPLNPGVEVSWDLSDVQAWAYETSPYYKDMKAYLKTTLDCPVCKKVFVRRYGRDRHLLTHTGERSFNCQQCNKSYPREDVLKRHMTTSKCHSRANNCPPNNE